MNIAFFDSKAYTRDAFQQRNRDGYRLQFFEAKLNRDTVELARGYEAVCVFVNDDLSAPVVEALAELGVGLVALRCAGYNNVDLKACEARGISVAHVPSYSPHAVAEHALALMLTLNRRIHRANVRVRDGNFSLDGLVGFDMYGKTVGIIGAGKIGQCLIPPLRGLGCRVLVADKFPKPDLARQLDFEYAELDSLFQQADIISLHAPLIPETRHLVNDQAIAKMKTGVMIINTSRGGLIRTKSLIDGLKSGKIGSAGLDVYEEETAYFFEDYSDLIISDDVLARLLTFNNVLVTSHQAFLTREALANIADTTYDNLGEYQAGKRGHELSHGICSRCT